MTNIEPRLIDVFVLTLITTCAIPPILANTREVVLFVDTRCYVQTWITQAFVNICESKK